MAIADEWFSQKSICARVIAAERDRLTHPTVTVDPRNVDDSMDREGLGSRFWIGLVLAAIACGVAAILVFAIFGFAWAAWGLIGAIIAFVALAATAAWAMDRRARRRWS